MVKAPLLKKGDKIAIIAPARKVTHDQVSPAITVFESWGLHVIRGRHLFSNSHNYLGATDAERREDFQSFIDDASVKAIICARGGYGSTRIVDQLTLTPLKPAPKQIIGFSDITAVHNRLFAEGFESVHAIMPILFNKEGYQTSVESLRQLLFEGPQPITCSPSKYNKAGVASGRLFGGNLSLVTNSLGTTSETDASDIILFIEEIDEYLYRLDRMLQHLKRNGMFARIRGLIVGHMTDIKDSEGFGETVPEVITRAVEGYDFPVCFNFPSGHDHPNVAWIHGRNVTLNVKENSVRMEYLEELPKEVM